MARFSLLFITLLIAALTTNVQSRVTTEENESESVIDTSIDVKPEDDLDAKIQELKRKVKELVEQGKENEQAFLGMSEKVRSMDSKVKEMTERLRKINNADYLNAGADAVEKL